MLDMALMTIMNSRIQGPVSDGDATKTVTKVIQFRATGGRNRHCIAISELGMQRHIEPQVNQIYQNDIIEAIAIAIATRTMKRNIVVQAMTRREVPDEDTVIVDPKEMPTTIGATGRNDE